MLSEAVLEPPVQESAVGGRDTSRRALSLDALRGLAILGMVLSGTVPYVHNTLPAWMYHAQNPPPTHAFDPSVIGMTWVDLVFPLFLFALGAAVPLALSQKLDAGISQAKVWFSAFMRGVLLLLFALYVQHMRPNVLTEVYGHGAYGISILAFAALFPILARLPARWPFFVRLLVRAAGWVGAIAILAFVKYPDGSGFTVHRHDIIIVILANVAITTAIIWAWAPFRYSGRLWVMAAVVTVHIARRYSPWGAPITELEFLRPLLGDRIFNGMIWACNPIYQKYLLITLPGTIAGDVLVAWLRPATRRLSFSIQNSRWRELSLFRCLCLAVLCMAIVVGSVAALSLPDWPTAVGLGVALGGSGFLILFSPPARKRLRGTAGLRGQPRVSALLFRDLFTWGMIWLALGLALYHYQGGIRKDPATLSYLFITAGLAHMALLVFAVITEALHRPGPLFLLIDNGQNPMIAYVASAMVVVPVLQLIPAGGGLSLLEWVSGMTTAPWAAFGRGVVITVVAAVFVSLITRLKIYWRT